MIARLAGHLDKRRVIAAVGLLMVGPVVWGVLREPGRPSYGGRPSASLDFKVPQEAKVGAEKLFGGTAEISVKPTSVSGQPIESLNPSTIAKTGRVFVDAFVNGDARTAFPLLVAADQSFFGSAEQFGATMARSAPWLNADVTAQGNSIVVAVQRTPQLDDALGLITANTSVTIPVTNESGIWRFDWRNRQVNDVSTLTDQTVRADVLAWAKLQQQCKPDATREHVTGLVGVSGFAGQLCGAKGNLALGETAPLDSLDDPGPFVDAFGSEVMEWGRVVTLRTPTNSTPANSTPTNIDMQVVVAPVGERWIVVGLARPNAVDAFNEVPAA
jgi:hypothetical protein